MGAHTKHDLKVYLARIPEYQKRFVTGELAIRERDPIGQIAMEHDISILSEKKKLHAALWLKEIAPSTQPRQ